ncbi:hypothetical protein V1264_003415 [Littorina saxatilis]|uniref:Uncharacterized protein n=1 Tax=Littorina saxatilis TaxID=31220 RepID=A0AAN9B5N6_9CAEN
MELDADAVRVGGNGNDVTTAHESMRVRRGRRNGFHDGLLLTLLLFLAVTYFPSAECTVLCNEFDTCFPQEQQSNVSAAVRQNNKQQVCTVATTAVECLQQARKDCDGYTDVPSYIVEGLEERKNKVTSYVASFCGSNGGDAVMNKMAATFWGTFLSLFLWFSS